VCAWDAGIVGDQEFGLIKYEDMGGWVKYTQRPAYYALKMFTNYFGDQIVKSSVTSTTFDVGPVQAGIYDWSEEKGIPNLNVIASVSEGSTYITVVNRSLTDDITAEIILNGPTPTKGTVYTLSGDSIEANNEIDAGNVVIRETETNLPGPNFNHTFKKHSVTVIKLK
jgi:alpha-L-arabinofuranosidase